MGLSALQNLSLILEKEFDSSRTLLHWLTDGSISVIWMRALAGRWQIFDISLTHSTAVRGMVCLRVCIPS